MFYAHFVLAKKGPLARIWLAAHWDKKLTKAHVFETNLEKSVEGILQPKVKMALRTSGHLLLGVVRIYSRKAKYLLADCNEAFVKIKMAFRPGMVDLPEDNREAAVNAITLPEVFHDFDTAMPDLNDVDISTQLTMNQTRAEEITMKEDYGNIPLDSNEDGDFGDMGGDMGGDIGGDINNDAEELARSGTVRESLQPDASNLFTDEQPSRVAEEDDFGGTAGDFGDDGGLFESGGGLFDEPAAPAPIDQSDITGDPSQAKVATPSRHSDDDDDHRDMDDFQGAPSPGGLSSTGGSRPTTPTAGSNALGAAGNDGAAAAAAASEADHTPMPAVQNQTTLINDENETFALAPVDASLVRGPGVRTKRKRKLVVDDIKAIAGEEMKAQLSDTADIVTTLDLAPPTKRLMLWKETGGVEKLFALPGRSLNSQSIFLQYQGHLISEMSENEPFNMLGDSETETINLEHVPGEELESQVITPRKRGRPPKKRPETEEGGDTPSPVKKSARLQAQQQAQQELEMQDLQQVMQQQQQNEVPYPNNVDPMGQQQQQQQQPPTEYNENSVFNSSTQQQQPSLQSDQCENMGYDQNNPNVTNMGWDEGQQGVPTPGAPSMGAPTPYRDDDELDEYYNPASIGQDKEEEMKEDETVEQFEDRVLNKRAAHLNTILKSKLDTIDELCFSELPIRRVKKAIAQNFYSLLVLQKVNAVQLEQSDSFVGEIHIRKGPNFETAVL